MALLQEEETQQELQNSPFCVLDGLYCEEEGSFEGDLVEEINANGDLGGEKSQQNAKKEMPFSFVLLEHDMFWDDGELLGLISKEKETSLSCCDRFLDGPLVLARKEAVDWILRVKCYYGFNALTAVLAVNYFDRFVTSIRFKTDNPWMSQLVAVACLSLAAKVEEIQVPLLVDLQVEDTRFVFEAKTIQRMELLVLSTLQWRMNVVTPISFFDHIIRRFGSKTELHLELLWRCERLLLLVITHARFVSYLPSVLAAAIMIYVIREVAPCDEVEYQNHLMCVLKVTQGKVNECYDIIIELLGNNSKSSNKRKHRVVPGSPNGVIDASFSSDGSNDSWIAAPMPEPHLKRSRVQVQQMRLPPINRMCVDVLSSPR